MNASHNLPYDIAIVGLGMVGVHQITHEVEEVMRRCRRVFITDMGVGVSDYLKTLGPKIIDLTTRREVGTHRLLIYRRMASEVVAAALEEPPICFASYGHPNVYCYPTTLIQRAAEVLDLKTTILPGISSLDTLLAILGLDPGFDGLQIYEASDLIIRARHLHTDVSTVIVQAPIVLEAHNRPGNSSVENLRILQRYLLKFYPADHVALLVTSKTHPLLESIKQGFPLGRLAEALQGASPIGTLYIPPVRHREIEEEDLAKRMGLETSKRPDTQPKRPGRPAIGPKAPEEDD